MKKNTNFAFVGLISLALISTLFLGCPDDGGDKKSDAKALTSVAGKTVTWGSETGAAAATAKTGEVTVVNGTTLTAADFAVSDKAKATVYKDATPTEATTTADYALNDDNSTGKNFWVKVTAEDDSVLWYKVTIKTASQASLDVKAALAGKTFAYFASSSGIGADQIFYDPTTGTEKLYAGSTTVIDVSGDSDLKDLCSNIAALLAPTDKIAFDSDALPLSITFLAASKTATQINAALDAIDDLAIGAAVTLSTGDVEIDSGKKLIIKSTFALTLGAGATITAGDLTIATAGSLTATGADVTIDSNGIKGATTGAKLELVNSVITLGNATAGTADTFAAALDAVDVYLKTGTASVVVTSADAEDSVATLTLKNGAKISGLTNPSTGTPGTNGLTGGAKWPGTGGLVATGLSATFTGTDSAAAAGNLIAQTTAGTPGTFAVTTQTGDAALDIIIVIGTVATATGA
ncbi:hypothetical protein FACS1894172_17940 [Spirochaetia bacterium]|nr:hypothetical protein FACS1894172_17940 [Spirochaetia bacterium]